VVQFFGSFFTVSSISVRRFLKIALFMMLPAMTFGSISTRITWSPSTDPSVTGYNIYYGTASHDYTNMISVGQVINATINDLDPGVAYYFAATSHDAYGNESAFSDEAVFAGYTVPSSGNSNLQIMPAALVNDQVTFSLAAGAPSAASINPVTGVLLWNSSLATASFTNDITVIITDLTNPGASMEESLVITSGDYLNLTTISLPVQTGQTVSLPLTSISSTGITNLVFTVNWPGDQLANPTLTFNAPITGGVLLNQGTNLCIQVWTAHGNALAGTNQFAQINFQVAKGETSAFLELAISGVSANKADGSTFANVRSGTGEVVVIGTNPLLCPQYNSGSGRTLMLYANPGTLYQIQYCTGLTSPTSWQTLEDYQPTNLVESVNLDSMNPTVFYRLAED
jgi:hypothetical protein